MPVGAQAGGGLSSYASQAFSTAYNQTTNAMNVNNSGNINALFNHFFNVELKRLDGLFLAAHNSAIKSDSSLGNAASVIDQKINYGTVFNSNYTTCP